jgi:ribosomal-protein-alanine N-acetyltransferase
MGADGLVTPFETDRLILRELTVEDAPFILELVNDPDWRHFIGDRGIRTLVDAGAYILGGPVAMYRRLGFGLWHVALKDQTPIGICGLIKRDTLDHVDIGFAFLPGFRGRGYAYEAASA